MKNVIILSGSPRIGGNSDKLCDEFKRGAETAGHQVEKINITKQDIRYCIGCGNCQKTGRCVQKDDMDAILDQMVKADVIVMATPVYFYNMNAQMKALIDRTCPRYNELGNKDYYIIMTAAEENQEPMQHVMESFKGFFDCLENVREKETIYALGVFEVNEILNHKAMQEAYHLGMHL